MMLKRTRCKLHGFTLLELIIVIIVVSTIASVALNRFLYYQERAERAMMESNLEMVKMGLRIHMAELIASNHAERLLDLERDNPMRWLSEPPVGYAGEYVTSVKTGNWYFASKEHELVYVPHSKAYLEMKGDTDGKELRFRAVLQYESNSVTGTKVPAGITVIPVNEFKWF